MQTDESTELKSSIIVVEPNEKNYYEIKLWIYYLEFVYFIHSLTVYDVRDLGSFFHSGGCLL